MGSLADKEKKLEQLALEEQIQTKKVSIAQKKALEREARKKEGKDWKQIFGMVKGLRPNPEVIQDLYAANFDGLREEGRINPRRLRR